MSVISEETLNRVSRLGYVKQSFQPCPICSSLAVKYIIVTIKLEIRMWTLCWYELSNLSLFCQVFVNFAEDQSDGTLDDSDTSSYSETSSTDNSNSLSSQSQKNVAMFNNPIYGRGVSLDDVKDVDLKYSDQLQRKNLPVVGMINPAYDAMEFDHSTYL